MVGRVLITGGGGFIGSHLIESLLHQGREVVCLDRFNPLEVEAGNLAAARGSTALRVAVGDMLDNEFLNHTFSAFQVDAVVHLAAQVNLRASVENPGPYIDANVAGTTNLLAACAKFGIPKFVFASSDSVYGQPERTPIAEDAPLRPLSPYAATKAAAEVFCYTYSRLFGLSVIPLRFFSPYGPRQRPQLAVSSFTRRIATGDEVLIYGDGSSQRDFTYVSDVVAGIEAALDSPVEGFQSINLSGGRPVSMLYLVRLIEQGLGEKARIRFMPARPEESHTLCADLTRARSILNYRPSVPIEDGIALFIAWWKASHSAPAGTLQAAPKTPASRKRNTVPSPRL